MDPVCDLMRINGLVRMAIGLLRGMEVDITEDTFKMNICSVISWFKIRERYALSSEPSVWRRRDLRGES